MAILYPKTNMILFSHNKNFDFKVQQFDENGFKEKLFRKIKEAKEIG
jgi:hypothetical protein